MDFANFNVKKSDMLPKTAEVRFMSMDSYHFDKNSDDFTCIIP